MIKSEVHCQGLVSLVLRGPDGEIKQSIEKEHNIVTNAGLEHNILLLKGGATAPNVVSHMGVGTGSTAAAATDTALGSEFTIASGSYERPTVTSTVINNASNVGDSLQYRATFDAGIGTGAITEAGLFNASTAGTMTNRVVFDVINKGANDSLECTWKMTVTR